jgi:hypothetical protein
MDNLIGFGLTTQHKKFFIDKYNDIPSRIQMINDFLRENYKPHQKEFKKYANIPETENKPIDYAIIVLSTMTPFQLSSIKEDYSNLDLFEMFEHISEEYDDSDSVRKCCCNKIITNVVHMRNKKSDINFTVGISCVEKRELKLIRPSEISKIKKNLEKKKNYKPCLDCKEYNISKKDVNETFCKNCKKIFKHICDTCRNEYESNKEYENCINNCSKCIKEGYLFAGGKSVELSHGNYDINGIRFKYKKGGYCSILLKQYETNTIFETYNYHLKQWINKNYPNLIQYEYSNKTFNVDLNINIVNKTIVNIELVDVLYE